MKNIVLMGAFLIASTLSISAQESSFGLKGGFNAAFVKSDSGFETETRNGFHIGIYGESRLSDTFAIQPELVYSQQGFTESDGTGEREQKLDYINLPIMLKIYLIPGLYVEGGPQVGLAINDKEEFRNFIGEGTIDRDPESFDYGVGLGAGFKLINGASIGIRYNIGLGDLYEMDNFNNRVFQVSLGLEL